MPGFDRTGPDGQGSQTGRRLGKCNPNNRRINQENIDEDDRFFGRRGRGRRNGGRFRFGRGNGRGFGRGNGN